MQQQVFLATTKTDQGEAVTFDVLMPLGKTAAETLEAARAYLKTTKLAASIEAAQINLCHEQTATDDQAAAIATNGYGIVKLTDNLL